MSTKLDIKTNNINSQDLYDEINEFIEIGLRTVGFAWTNPIHRESLGEQVTAWLDEFYENGKITQYKITYDQRINPPSQSNDIFKLHVSYKQKHCLNVTSIKYTASQNVTPDNEDLEDWITLP